MADIRFLSGSNNDFQTSKVADGQLHFAVDSNGRAYLYFGYKKDSDSDLEVLNIVPTLLGVPNGGTGASTFAAGEVLIGNDTDAVSTRGILHNNVTSGDTLPELTNDNLDYLVTANTIKYWNGAYEQDGNTYLSNITKVGAITSGTWTADTISVQYGGTGSKSFTQGGVIYATGTNGQGAMSSSNEGAKGQILDGNGGTPLFVTPELNWVGGTTNGPTIKLTINGVDYTKTIPSASATSTDVGASGIVTTGTQSFAGAKRFYSVMTTSSIQPDGKGTRTLGSATAPWANMHTKDITFYYVNGTSVTKNGAIVSSSGILSYEMGNAANKVKGNIKLYNNNEYATVITSNATGGTDTTKTDKTVAFPDFSGNIVISNIADTTTSSTTATYRLPFYQSDKQYLGSNSSLNVSLDTAEAGLIVGDTNKKGFIQFYGPNDETYSIISNNNNGKANYKMHMPELKMAVDDTGTLDNNTQGQFIYQLTDGSGTGNINVPVYIASSGRAKPITSAISVPLGGTGRATLTKNGVLYGEGTSAVGMTSASGAAGHVLYTSTAGGAPSFGAPTLGLTQDGSQVTIAFKIAGTSYSSISIGKATGTKWGVVSDDAQVFGGAKTFNGAVTMKSSLTVEGALKAKSLESTESTKVGTSLTVGTDAIINGDAAVYGGQFYLGTSTTDRATFSYDADSDTLTISFPA